MHTKYIKEIISNNNQENLNKLGDLLRGVIDHIKKYDIREYEEIEDKLYILAYGEKLNEKMAKDWVSCMKPFGEHWTLEQTRTVATQYNIPDAICDYTWYATMNMAWNDFNGVFGSDTNIYIKYAKAWLEDADGPEPDVKAYRYYCLMKQ